MKFRYQDLRVGGDILALIDYIYDMTEVFPPEERYTLLRQIRRAATSVYLNLAEGTARKSHKDFARFITTAQGSLVEVHACATIACRRKYFTQEQLQKLESLVEIVWIQLSALHSSQINVT